jgi:amino acid permease
MPPDDSELLTREEVLDGLLGRRTRRASILLFLIESRTAHLVAQAQRTMECFLVEEAAGERDLAFLESFALGREPPLRPAIQDLERYAPQWAALIPENPEDRAAVAHVLARKYEFTYQAVPGIRAALGLDEEAVRQAYQSLYSQSLETIFSTRTGPGDRLRWVWARLGGWLESLPPFWTAFALTLTETVGAGILALPIALASVGPLAGVAFLVVLGLVNVLTIAFMAEAITRSGTIRYGSAFIGRAVADYLGRLGGLILTVGLFIICFIALLAFYVGFSTTLADATHIRAEFWVLLLFLVGVYFVRRESLDATVASALVVGAINIGLILILSLLAFTHMQPANLLYVNVPFLNGRPFDPSILQLVFGVVLSAYFGHLSVSNCAQVVLRRDPGGRSLIWGVMAAQVAALVLYCIWVLAVNGAVAPQMLVGESGTALIPLAAQVGPVVHVFGTLFVILGMGMASIHFSLGLFNLTREWLPQKPRSIVRLPRRRGQLLLCSGERGMVGVSGSGLRLGLTYLGLVGDQPQFRLDVQVDGATHHVEMAVTGSWEVTALFDRLPDLRQHGRSLALEVQEADQEGVLLRVASPLSLTYRGEWATAGLSIADVIALPEDQRQLVNWMMRREAVSLAEVAAHTGQDEAVARAALNGLVEQGFIRELEVDGETRYQLRLALRRGRQIPEVILGEEGGKRKAEGVFSPQLLSSILSGRGRFFLSLAPGVFVFLLTEWLVLTGAESFTGPINFLGVIVISLLAGIFPVLLLVASRRKGEIVPGVIYRFLGHPVLLVGIYLLSLTGLFLHGLVIWEDPVQRGIALAVGVMMLGVTIAMGRRGAFARRLVVELREDRSEGEQARFAVTAGGQPAETEVRLGYPDGEQHHRAATGEVPTFSALRYARFQLPVTRAQELKVWAHEITPEGDSEGLPALLEADCGREKEEFDLKLAGGQVTLPLTGEACHLEITLPESAAIDR